MKKPYIKHRLSLLSTLLLRARYSLEAPPLNSAMARYLIRVRQMLEEWDTS